MSFELKYWWALFFLFELFRIIILKELSSYVDIIFFNKIF